MTSTSAQDYKQAHRFADITYSGVFNDETNLNKLNEFNLGLLNFKPLEDSYGPITVLDGRETDILTLQEDKISYVLQGKNLLSDSTGGGAVTSVPEVLGTQIARIEDYGNSNNPESYAVWGADKFFTDAKRGAVLQLKGSSAQSEQLQVISEFGMRSFFRDFFIEDFNTFKLGGYDPYMNEYVLTNSNLQIPELPQEINCGVSRTITLNGESEQFIYQLGNLVGLVTVTFFVTDYSGVPIPYTGTYNGAVVLSGNITSDGLVSITFDKNIVSQDELILNFGAYGSSTNTLVEVTVSCPDAPTITVIQVAITSNNEEGQFVHNEYRWLDGTFVSALQSEQVEFNSGTGLIVSQYTSTSAPQGGNLIPANGATVRIISNKISALGDDFVFNPVLNKFRYHRSSTLYTNTPAQVQALLNVATTATPISGAAPTYEANFPMPNTSDEFLYLIWDYRAPTPIELCFSDVSCAEACCECESDPVPTDNLLVELCYDSLSTTTSPLTEVIPPTSGVTVGSFVNLTINPDCTYVVTAVTQASVTDTVSNIQGTKTDCSQICDQYEFSAVGLSSGTYSYVDCSGVIQNGTVPAGQSIQVCANSISALTNITATHLCGCSLNLIVERCQEPNTGTPDTQIISFNGENIGQLVNLTGGQFTGCKYEVIATTLDPVTASKLSNQTGQCCNAYFVENITPTTQLFSYVDCFNIAQSFNISAGGVQIVCLQDFTQQPLNFSVTFQTCDCTPT